MYFIVNQIMGIASFMANTIYNTIYGIINYFEDMNYDLTNELILDIRQINQDEVIGPYDNKYEEQFSYNYLYHGFNVYDT
jgi:hypothetical protein